MSPEVKEFLADIQSAVEATNAEQMFLWERHHTTMVWNDRRDGYGCQIGTLAGKPICLSLLKATIDGRVVLFWHPTSMVVDYEQIEKWFKDFLPEALKTNTMNFTHAFPRKAHG